MQEKTIVNDGIHDPVHCFYEMVVLAQAKINKTFRSECVSPFFSDAERAAHKATHRNTLTPTFGFEAVVHALYACASVDAFGFFLDPRLDEPAPACVAPPCPLEHYQPRQDVVPYH